MQKDFLTTGAGACVGAVFSGLVSNNAMAVTGKGRKKAGEDEGG